MPIYEYECSKCQTISEKIFKVSDFPRIITCPKCDYIANKILSASGSIQCDSINDVSWLKSACDNLQRPHEPRIQTRGEYKRYMKDHNIVAVG